jgi:hypothetical protein
LTLSADVDAEKRFDEHRASLTVEVRKLIIVVSIKLLPDANADQRVDSVTKRLVRRVVETVFTAIDELAIEAVLRLEEKPAEDSTVSRALRGITGTTL